MRFVALATNGEAAMGQVKERQVKAWDDWKAEARFQARQCSQCTRTPEHDERDIFFMTGMCASCATSTGALAAYWRVRGLGD